jgi:hypothetical protein
MGAGWRLASVAVELVDRLAILVAVRGFLGMVAAPSRSLHLDNYVRMQHVVCRSTYVSFLALLFGGGGCAAKFNATYFAALYGSLGSYLCDALHVGSADLVARLHVPRG